MVHRVSRDALSVGKVLLVGRNEKPLQLPDVRA